MKTYNEILKEVYMSNALYKDLDKSRSKKIPRYSIYVDGFNVDNAGNIKGASTKYFEHKKVLKREEKIDEEEAIKRVWIYDNKMKKPVLTLGQDLKFWKDEWVK